MLEVKYKKLVPNAVTPTKAHPTDSGFDLTCVSVEWDEELGIVTCRTGIALILPELWGADIRARSSIYKLPLILANGVGTVDNSYHGELLVKFRVVNTDAEAVLDICKQLVGSRVAQLVLHLVPTAAFSEVKDLPDTSRGGFGSTGA